MITIEIPKLLPAGSDFDATITNDQLTFVTVTLELKVKGAPSQFSVDGNPAALKQQLDVGTAPKPVTISNWGPGVRGDTIELSGTASDGSNVDPGSGTLT